VITKWKGLPYLWEETHEPWIWTHALETPLLRRGWVLQEWLLARRTLHFGEKMVYWECREMTASEYDPEGIELQKRPFKIPYTFGGTSTDGVEILKLWMKLVMKYSGTSITRSEDKLIAISGISKEFDRLFRSAKQECQYLAGMWSMDLVYQLLWRRDTGISWDPKPSQNPQHDLKSPPAYRAPSWSWASVDFKIRFMLGDIWRASVTLHTLIDIINYQVEPLEEDSSLQIIGGRLHARGWLFTVGYLYRVTKPWSMEILSDYAEPTETPLSADRRFVLPIAFFQKQESPFILKVHGLILKSTGDGIRSFERVGRVRFDVFFEKGLELEDITHETSGEDYALTTEPCFKETHQWIVGIFDKWSSAISTNQTEVVQHFLEATKSLQCASPDNIIQGYQSNYLYDIKID
jgi:hypothetical protein